MILHFVFSTLLLVSAASAHGPRAPGDSTGKDARALAAPITSRDTTIVVAAGTTFDLNKASGRLTIRAWDRAEVRIRVIGPRPDPYDIVMTGNALSVRARHAMVPRQPAFSVKGQSTTSATAMVFRDAPDAISEYEITVPRTMGGKAGGIAADVSLSGLHSSVHAVVLNGNLDAQDIEGSVILEALSGRVSARRVTGAVSVVSPNEHVTIEDVEGSVTVRSINGGITLDRVALTAADVQTYNGGIRLAGRMGGAGPFVFSTFNGDLSFMLENATALAADLATGDGKLTWPTTGRFNGDPARHRGVVTIGDGSLRLTAETFHGDITISISRIPR